MFNGELELTGDELKLKYIVEMSGTNEKLDEKPKYNDTIHSSNATGFARSSTVVTLGNRIELAKLTDYTLSLEVVEQ